MKVILQIRLNILFTIITHVFIVSSIRLDWFDGEEISAPVIREAITGGRAQISGGDSGFAYQEAKTMVDLLNAGALPVPAKIIQENTVGPTLGADSIAKSKIAGILGLSFVMLFMVAFYRAPGIIANIALVIYGLILFALFLLAGRHGVDKSRCGVV